MRIKKKYIEGLLLLLSSYDAKTMQPVSGLLFENIGLGLKRKLQKIHKWLQAEYTQLKEDRDEATKVENSAEELKKLLDEEITSDMDYAQITEIEKVQTANNYDFDLIEMIAK